MNRQPYPLEKPTLRLSKWIDTPEAFDLDNIRESLLQGKKRIRRNVKGIWNKRLELFFGFIPALLVFLITYGKKFR